MSIEGLSRKRSGSIVSKHFERRCFIKSYCKELSHQSNEVFPFPVQDLKSKNDWPVLGNPKPNTHRPSPWAKLPASVVAARANPAPPPPQTAVMTKAKAAPKIGSRRNSNSKASHASPKMRAKWSPAHTASSVMTTAAAAADLDPLPEPQQPAQEDVPSTAHQDAKEESDAGAVTSQKSDEKKEDKHEKKEDKQEKEDKHEKKEDKHEEKEDKHEEKEDKHEEKTESNHQEDGSSSQEPIPRQESSSEHGESRGDVDESASSAAVEPTPVPEIDEIARAKEAPQALCLCVGMYQWPRKIIKHQCPMSTLE